MKRLLSVLLCICMVMTLIPAMAMAASDTVYVGGYGMGDGSIPTYYRNDGEEGSEQYYNAKLYDDNGTLTLVLNGFEYEGTERGVDSDAELKIVLEGANVITSTADYGIRCDCDLDIVGTVGSSLDVTSTNENAIMAYDDYMGYNESITITNADITATAGGDVGIVASESLTISGSVIETSGKYHGLQGGGFTQSEPTSITITDSSITATAIGAGDDKIAFKSAPNVTGDYQWRSAVDGEWIAYVNTDDDFTAAKYIEFKPGSPAGEGGETPAPTGTTYAWAYDCQRSPAFPSEIGEEITLSGFDLPLKREDGEYISSEGEWTLTEVGPYNEFDPAEYADSNLDDVVNSVADAYDLEDGAEGELIVHVLTDESEAIVGYGVLIGVDETNGYALFIGDALDYDGAGYLLSKTEITDDYITFITEEMVDTEIGDGEGGDDEEEEDEEQPTGKGHYGGLQAGGDKSTTGKDKLGSEYEKEDEPETETKPNAGVSGEATAGNRPSAKFADLNTSAWYYADVEYVIEKGLFNGTSSTAFSPNGKLTRAMLVAVLYRAAGSPATNKSIPFADVDMGAYYANAVSWAQQNRIVTGVSETKFAPDENITREQIATILFRYASYNGKNMEVKEEALSFADASSVSNYALAAMTWNIKNCFVQGRSGNKLAPREFATRAEAAALLHRFLEAK